MALNPNLCFRKVCSGKTDHYFIYKITPTTVLDCADKVSSLGFKYKTVIALEESKDEITRFYAVSTYHNTRTRRGRIRKLRQFMTCPIEAFVKKNLRRMPRFEQENFPSAFCKLEKK